MREALLSIQSAVTESLCTTQSLYASFEANVCVISSGDGCSLSSLQQLLLHTTCTPTCTAYPSMGSLIVTTVHEHGHGRTLSTPLMQDRRGALFLTNNKLEQMHHTSHRHKKAHPGQTEARRISKTLSLSLSLSVCVFTRYKIHPINK